MYSLSLGIWISTLIGYGDKLTGVRNISCQQNQPDKITGLISETLNAQSYLMILIAVIIVFLGNVHALHNKKTLLWLAFGYGVVQGFHPLWIFQSINKLTPLAYLELFANTLTLLLVIFFLPAHPLYSTAMLIIIFARLPVNLAAYKLLFSYKIYIHHTLWRNTLFRLKQGFSLFFMITSVSIYTTLNTTLLGFFSGLATVGVFSSVEKLTRSFTAIILPISQAIMPHRYYLQNYPDQIKILNKYIIVVSIGIAIFVSMILYEFSQKWVNWFLGASYHDASNILKILAWIIPCYVFSTILSSQFLIPNHKDNICSAIYFGGGLINVMLALIIVPKYGAIGMSYTELIAEFFVLIVMIFSVKIFL